MKTQMLFVLVLMLGCAHQNKKQPYSNLPILTEAYTFGFPLLLMDRTRTTGLSMHRPDPDLLYSQSSIDLSKRAVILEVPNTQGRYYQLSILDAWTNVYASIGKRTTGTDAQKFMIVGPRWTGKTLPNVTLMRSPTNLNWIIIKIQVKTPKEARLTARELQKKFRLYTPTMRGREDQPSKISMSGPLELSSIVEKVFALRTEDFFNHLNQLMINNPPAQIDRPSLIRFARLGIAPGAHFSMDSFPETEKTSIGNIPQLTRVNFENNMSEAGREKNGCFFPHRSVGHYLTNYKLRALIAHQALGAPLIKDEITAVCTKDGNGDGLNGSKNYLLHFTQKEIPPTKAFWSITAYGARAAPHSIGSRNKLKYNSDGSLDIFIQQLCPTGDVKLNCLVAPEGDYTLITRIYWPVRQALNSDFSLPPILPSVSTDLSYKKID